MINQSAPFHVWGVSHWAVLTVLALGSAGMVLIGRQFSAAISTIARKTLAVSTVGLNLGMEMWAFRPADAVHTLPLQLSDLAPYIAGIGLCGRQRWACSVTAYWCLSLSSQALITPALQGPDFPSLPFLVFFANHILVVWAAVLLVWGLDLRPRWRDYRTTLLITAAWAAAVGAFNTLAGTNYGFLNAKPSTPSLLDLLGPWPWYLLPEAAAVIGIWALLTRIWQPRYATAPDRQDTA